MIKVRKLSEDAHEVINIMVNKKTPMNEAQLKAMMAQPTKLPYVIKRLRKVGVMISVANLNDMRRVYYAIDNDSLARLKEEGLR